MRPDIDAIQKRVEAATAAPWSWGWDQDANPSLVTAKVLLSGTTVPDAAYGVVGPHHRRVAVTESEKQGYYDADFIANARQDVPELLRYIDRLEATIRQLEAETGHAGGRD